ncbi:MAG TPA: sulfite exporter TauE/SafE family protein, partial [Clostridia bacterium]|nr:sulfite exporter TauE/SafE family protein [Clostridia bacterium]
ILMFLMNVLETVAGFGSISIGVPILSLMYGAETSIALLTASSLVLCVFVLATQYKKINVREFLIIVACIVPIMPIGYLLYSKLRFIEWALRLIMGILITFVSLRELWLRSRKKEYKEMSRTGMYISLGVGAVIQGMFSMGAPLINVYALTRLKDKSNFRATMVAVWVVTNIISTLYRALVLHVYTKPVLTNLAYALPLVVIAFFVGNWLHHKISNERFSNIVYSIQLASGLISIVGGVSVLL